QRPLPVPTEDYASVSIQQSETSARSSIPQPRASSDVAEASRDGQSPDARSGTGEPARIEANNATAPSPPASDRSADPVPDLPMGVRTELDKMEANPPGAVSDIASASTSPGLPPDSRLANGERRSEIHATNVGAKSTFIGSWTDTAGRCRTGRQALLVINSRA